MRTWWTVTPEVPTFCMGLWAEREDAKTWLEDSGLNGGHVSYLVTPICADDDCMADRLLEAGVARDAIDEFDGTPLAIKALSDALRDTAYHAGKAELAAWEARMRFELAGRICFWCGRVATVAGYGDGEARLACDRHAPELERRPNEDGLGELMLESGVAPQVVDEFDGTRETCARLARALMNSGTDVGQE